MLSKLRSVCILDKQVFKVRRNVSFTSEGLITFTQDLNDATFERMKTSPKTQVKRVKRKVGYDGGDDGESTSQAMKKLNLSSNVEQRDD